MKVIGYCRVSTDEQAQEGVSLDAQRAKIRAWAALNDHELVEIYGDEGISGKAMANRPGLNGAIAHAARVRGILFVYSLSRLSRSTRDTIFISDSLAHAGAELASWSERLDTTTAAGKMFFRFMAVLAEFERDTIAERTQAALDHKWARGEALGNNPFGFSTDHLGNLVVNEAEMPALRSMLALETDPEATFASIARRLDAAGLSARGGKAWDRGVVRRILAYYKSDRGRELLARITLTDRGTDVSCGAQPGAAALSLSA